MTDIELLKQAIKDSGVTLTFLTRKLGCSRRRIYNIINGMGGDPTAREIVILSECLHLTTEQRDAIFLAKV